MSEGSPTRTADQASTDRARSSRLVSASAVMAAGTMISRVLGFGRLMLLGLLFGNGTRQAEMFTLANTVPTSMYILLAGGVLNTVLVPQIVRAIRSDPDGGEAYTNRIMTAGLIVLGGITIALTLAVPVVISLYSASGWKSPALSAQYDSMTMLAYYCMPQIFFYGVHVLAGQVLNARDKFGPMMWAPIANNLVSILVLVAFLLAFSPTNPARAFTGGQELLLGLGSTLGIAVQAAVLVPFLRAAGYHFRPRFDFRNTGLGKTFGLAKWTLGFVLVTQVALVVVNRLASGATVGGAGAGLAAYYNAYAVWILPHSLITVSLATAMLPAASRLAAAGDLVGVRAETSHAMRLAVTALLPASVAMVALGLPIAQLAFGFGQGAKDATFVGWALMALAVGLVPFTVQYVCLRAFYALEDTRTTFLLQILISGANVVLGVAVVLLLDRPSLVATGLALAYSAAYLIGVVVSFRVLARRLPGLSGTELLRHCLRLFLAVAPAGAVAFWITWGFGLWSTSQAARLLGLAVAGVVAVGMFLLLARVLRITEVNDIVATVLRRGRGRRSTPVAVNDVAGENTPGDADDPGSPGDSTVLLAAVSPTIETATASPNPPTSPGGSAAGLIGNVDPMVSPAGAVRPTQDDRGLDDDPGSEDRYPGADDAVNAPVHPSASLPAGTVLAQRYRLEELLAQSVPTVTWRAFDQVLSRSVLVHLLPPHDADAEGLLDAARRAAAATDSRFLRVLDAVHSDDDVTGSYIVCEFATGQSLETILAHGPLSGLEAGWVVREVADALSAVHGLGLFHRRINPDTVIITPTGNVKIVGLMIEAHLRPTRGTAVVGADSPELTDVTDLGRLLYACLVSRWPGGPAYSLPAAPVVGHHWMTPRQVRAGVSPALDNVSDQILGDPPRHRAPRVTSANEVVNALTKVLGTADASGDLERRLRQPIPKVRGTEGGPVSALLDQETQPMSAVVSPRSPSIAPDPARRPVSPAAYEASQATMIRTPAPPSGPRKPATTHDPRPPRRWIPIVAALAVLLIIAGIISAVALHQRLGPSTTGTPSTQPSASAAAPVKLAIAGGRDFDPEGNKTENPDEVALAFDGKPTTRWRTVNYIGNPKLGGIKNGVGIVVDLGSAQTVRSAKLTLSGSPTSLELRVPKSDPAGTTRPPMGSAGDWTAVAKAGGAGSSVTLTVDQPVTTRYLLVYLTSLPKEGSGYRGGIYEVEVFQ